MPYLHERRRLWLVGPEGEQLALPGQPWHAGCDLGYRGPIYFRPLSKADANGLLVQWEHPLGPYRRPFGFQAWGMAVDGRAIAVAVSGSTVSRTVTEQLHRYNAVELARIARAPDDEGIMRAMLRLWRDYLAPKWGEDYWPVEGAVSYALPGKTGNLYRFDGWHPEGWRKPSSGGGTWSNRPVALVGAGPKKLYTYTYRKGTQ
jgi:hypothetical protein